MSNQDFSMEDTDNAPRQQAQRQTEQRDTSYDSRVRGGQQTPPPPTGGFSFADIGANQARANVGGLSDAALEVIQAVFNEAKGQESSHLPEALRRNRFKLIPMASVGDADPALVVTLPGYTPNTTYAYTLVIEQPGALKTRPLKDGREDYESIVFPEDQLNKKFFERLATLLPPTDLKHIGSQVILAETAKDLNAKYNPDDHVTRQRVASILNNAIDALSSYYERHEAMKKGEYRTANSITPQAVPDGGRMELTYDFPVEVECDTSGLPIRSDVVARVTHSIRSRDEFDTPANSRVVIGTATAGIDLYYQQPKTDNSNAFSRRNRDDVPAPYLQAVLDISSVRPGQGVPFNVELMMYLINAITPLTDDYQWVRTLRPKSVIDGVGVATPLVDLGALTLLDPNREQAGYTEGLSANTSDEDLMDYLSGIVLPEVAVGITIASSGERSATTAIFDAIAKASTIQERARYTKILYNAINVATGGEFAPIAEQYKITDVNFAPISALGVRELIGCWRDSNGTLRANSEWNMPAFLSAVKRQQDAANIALDYQLTYETAASGRSWDYNLTERLNMIQRYRVCPSFRPVGTAEKYVFDMDFLRAVSEAFSKTRLDFYTGGFDRINQRRQAGATGYSRHAGSNAASYGEQSNVNRGQGRGRNSSYREDTVY